MRSVVIKLITLCVWLSLALQANAEQAERFGPYVAHYNTMNTTFLTPEVATAYGITRSGSLALINIAILEVAEDGLNQPVYATVSVDAANLAGQRKTIEMMEVEDGGAIYYVGTFRIRDEERITFNVTVQPKDQASRVHRFRFNQMFYVEE